MNGCDSRFAIAELKSGDSCGLREEPARSWKVVPQVSPEDANTKQAGKTSPPEAPWTAAPDAKEPEKFCVYEWGGSDLPSQKDLDAINAKRECAVALAMAPGGPPVEVLKPLSKAFDRQARGIAGDGVAEARRLFARGKGGVEVAVVDATPFGVKQPDTSGHGFAVSRVIGYLGCDDADSETCDTMVRPYLAMPLVPGSSSGTWVEDRAHGGYMGTFHDLFKAFHRALANWDQTRKLIINLSLGWDPIKTEPTSWEVHHMTVLLERAYCEGALVVVAAGNLTGSSGPLYPALLETNQPPSASRCLALVPKLSRERLREIEADTSRYAPLVHSVGGVDGRDERLAITRPWGHPRLAAYGMEVTAPAKKVEKGYTEPLTGTSMSAAIVSGIAAGVWRARPTLTAAEVIGLVYSSGRLLDAKAGNRWTRTEYCLNKQDERCEKWPPRRASFCEAMKIAADSKLKCVNPAEALTAEYYPPVPPPPATPGPVSDPCKISNCGGLVGPMAVQMSSHVMPQPGTTVCPSCVLKLSYAFGHGAVYGTATLRPVATLQSTYVRTYDPYSNPQDFLIPNPTSGSPFTSLLNPPANTASAVNNWYYQIGTIYLTDTTSLIVQP